MCICLNRKLTHTLGMRIAPAASTAPGPSLGMFALVEPTSARDAADGICCIGIGSDDQVVARAVPILPKGAVACDGPRVALGLARWVRAVAVGRLPSVTMDPRCEAPLLPPAVIAIAVSQPPESAAPSAAPSQAVCTLYAWVLQQQRVTSTTVGVPPLKVAAAASAESAIDPAASVIRACCLGAAATSHVSHGEDGSVEVGWAVPVVTSLHKQPPTPGGAARGDPVHRAAYMGTSSGAARPSLFLAATVTVTALWSGAADAGWTWHAHVTRVLPNAASAQQCPAHLALLGARSPPLTLHAARVPSPQGPVAVVTAGFLDGTWTVTAAADVPEKSRVEGDMSAAHGVRRTAWTIFTRWLSGAAHRVLVVPVAVGTPFAVVAFDTRGCAWALIAYQTARGTDAVNSTTGASQQPQSHPFMALQLRCLDATIPSCRADADPITAGAGGSAPVVVHHVGATFDAATLSLRLAMAANGIVHLRSVPLLTAQPKTAAPELDLPPHVLLVGPPQDSALLVPDYGVCGIVPVSDVGDGGAAVTSDAKAFYSLRQDGWLLPSVSAGPEGWSLLRPIEA
jgi:hypothetical protein